MAIRHNNKLINSGSTTPESPYNKSNKPKRRDKNPPPLKKKILSRRFGLLDLLYGLSGDAFPLVKFINYNYKTLIFKIVH